LIVGSFFGKLRPDGTLCLFLYSTNLGSLFRWGGMARNGPNTLVVMRLGRKGGRWWGSGEVAGPFFELIRQGGKGNLSGVEEFGAVLFVDGAGDNPFLLLRAGY
jgi:hypothetical protein